MTMRTLYFSILVLVGIPLATAQDEVETKARQDIRDLMTSSEFRQAGLEKLSPAELDYLNRWLYGFAEVERKEAVEEERQVVEAERRAVEAEREAVEAERQRIEAERQAVAQEKQVVAQERKAVEEEAAKYPKGEEAFGIETVASRVAKIFERDQPEVIETRAIGRFEGWEGGRRPTVFRLENGQVWRVADRGADTYYYPAEAPTVQIEKGAMGAYYLNVKGEGKRVRVIRVE